MPRLALPAWTGAVMAMAAVLSITLGLGGEALAHETRMVGPYRFVVGWLNEPAFQGQPNAASVRISDTRDSPASPVEGVEQTLRIEVVAGGLTETYSGALRTVFGQPGLYALHMIPTASGAYAYRVTGKVEDLDINETFESGPGRFDEVESQSVLQYPTKVPAAAELTQRLEAIERDLATSRILGIAAAVLGIAAFGLVLFRRRGNTARP